jgi:pyrroloquinoline-quinone synthase
MLRLNDLTEAPLSSLSAAAFVEGLQELAEESEAANHPLLLALAAGGVADLEGAIRAFLLEYYVYSRSFTRHLSAVSSTLESPAHRAALVPNSAEESGAVDEEHLDVLAGIGLTVDDVRAPHPELFRRFLAAIGLTERELAAHTPDVATIAWIESFHSACREDEAQGIGALGIATEGIVRRMYGSLLRAIALAWPDLSARDTAFFRLHAAVDDDHANVLRDIAIDLAATEAGRRRMAIGVLKALQVRASFFDHILRSLESTAAVDIAIRAEAA